MNYKLMFFGMIIIAISFIFFISSDIDLKFEVEEKNINTENETLIEQDVYIEVSNTNLCEFMNAKPFNNTHCVK